MTPRTLLDRLLSPAGFGLALLFFFLPFVTVSCDATARELGGESLEYGAEGAFTGVDLLIGGAPEAEVTRPTEAGGSETIRASEGDVAQFEEYFAATHPPQPLAIVAAVVILLGMAGSLLLPRALAIRASAAAALAALVLLVVEVVGVAPMLATDAWTGSDIYRSLQEAQRSGEMETTIEVHTRPGFGFYLTAALLVALAARQFLAARRPPPPPAQTADDAAAP